MSGDWPQPSFAAPRLPRRQKVRYDGFTAEWRLAAPNPAGPLRITGANRRETLPGKSVGVTLFEPVNLYAVMSRAVKYAVLLIALTFAACLAIELATGPRCTSCNTASSDSAWRCST